MYHRILSVLMAFLFLLPVPSALAQEASTVEAPLYVGVANRSIAIRASEDREAEALASFAKGDKVYVFGYSPQWLDCQNKQGVRGYVLRQYVDTITPVDPVNTPPYGSQPHPYAALVAQQAKVYARPDDQGDALCSLTPGSRISILALSDGWATVQYQRQLGYVHVSKLKGLTPVAPTVDYARSGDMIACFTSYYSVATTELNLGRMVNIDVSCDYISMVLEPGQKFSFNQIAGPYREARGYKPSPVLINGTTVTGYGGGTCQVSSTLYNTLLLLPEGLRVLYRRPHGPAGAKYLPHGVDAAVGNESLDLVFQNDYGFPIRIEANAQDGALTIAIYKV